MIPVQQRRWIARAIKLGLVGAAVLVVMAWIGTKRAQRSDEHGEHGEHTEVRIEPDVRVEPAPRGGARASPARTRSVETLAPGDVRIFNIDSSVNLILRGDDVLAGLSPQMRDKITQEIAQSTTDDTAGFGGAVANMVRTTVASAIAHHAVVPVRDIREIQYEDGQLILVRNNGRRFALLEDVKTDGEKISRTFAREDALRFMEAVRARKRALEHR
jgi:hypothetical protein